MMTRSLAATEYPVLSSECGVPSTHYRAFQNLSAGSVSPLFGLEETRLQGCKKRSAQHSVRFVQRDVDHQVVGQLFQLVPQIVGSQVGR